MITTVTLTRYNCRCERCGYEWQTNADAVPKVCGRCKSQRWNEAKRATMTHKFGRIDGFYQCALCGVKENQATSKVCEKRGEKK